MIDLYTAPTPNGHKASIMLEELGVPYRVIPVDISRGDQKRPEYMLLNPNGRIPTIVDREAGDFAVFESGAILIYLAEKYGRFLPADVQGRSRAIQWLMFQMGGIGPMFGQLGYFYRFAGREVEDKRPQERYASESRRLLGVLEGELARHEWIAGSEYSIADIAIFPWVRNLIGFYAAGELVGYGDFPHVNSALERFVARPAVARGLEIPSAPSGRNAA